MRAEGDISSRKSRVECSNWGYGYLKVRNRSGNKYPSARLTFNSERVLGRSVSIRSCTDLARSA